MGSSETARRKSRGSTWNQVRKALWLPAQGIVVEKSRIFLSLRLGTAASLTAQQPAIILVVLFEVELSSDIFTCVFTSSPANRFTGGAWKSPADQVCAYRGPSWRGKEDAGALYLYGDWSQPVWPDSCKHCWQVPRQGGTSDDDTHGV